MNEFTPVYFEQATTTLSGQEIQKNNPDLTIKDIPCFRDGSVVVTQWQLKGFLNRLKFLFNPKISIIVLGTSQPPLSIRIDDPFSNEQKR